MINSARALSNASRASFFFAGLALCMISARGAGSEHPIKATLDRPIVLTQVPAGNTRGEPAQVDWFAGARLVLISPQGDLKVLSEGFHSACDPDVSFDGHRVIFAGKKNPNDKWRIWETGVDGQGLRPVSPEELDARSPIYVSALFTLDSPEPWTTLVFVGRENTVGEGGQSLVSSLYNVKLDGTELRRLTFNPNRNFDPVQMWDGRLVYCAERFPNTTGNKPRRISLYATHIEGADMELYGGEKGGPIQHMPCSLPMDRVVFIEPDPSAVDGAGQLASVTEGRPHTTYDRLKQGNEFAYLFPSALSDGRILVSRRSSNVGSQSGLYRLDTRAGTCELVLDTPEYHEVQGKLAVPREKPDGHSTVVEARFQTGTFYGLNAYDADEHIGAHLKPGEVKRVRLIEGVAQAGQDSVDSAGLPPFVPRRLVGEAPVETDGSFNVEVPADIPLLLQTLDERGAALATCGWIWVKPKETRGCIGCHEDPERTPENEYVLALRRTSNRLTLAPEQRRSLSFRDDIAPILAKSCASTECHGGKKTDLFLPLSSNAAEADLRKAYGALMQGVSGKKDDLWPQPGRYIDPGRARTSWLIWQLAGTNTSRPWDQIDKNSRKVEIMPPPGKGTPLTPEEQRTIIQWVDMGAQYEPVRTGLNVAKTGQTKSK